MNSDSDHDERHKLLDLLEAHGQQFLQSFDLPELYRKRKIAEERLDVSKRRRTDSRSEDDIEWTGISLGSSSDESDMGSAKDSEVNEDDFTSGSPSNVVVFSESTGTKSGSGTLYSEKKSFLSSRIVRLNGEPNPASEKHKADEEDDHEVRNVRNDALLHQLVHTKLLSGSLNRELDMTPAQRRKALAGRVMELAGDSKLGKGEKSVRKAERNRASKSVRDGLLEKQKLRQRKQVEEAKRVGNYHPALKSLFVDDEDKKMPKTRERGLKLGVGKFRGGTLKLSRRDLPAALSSDSRSQSRKGRKGR